MLLVSSGHADSFDLPLRQTLLELDLPMANRAWRFATFLGSGMVITIFSVVCVLFLTAQADWRIATHFTVLMAGAVILENSLKYVVHRQRPDELYPQTMPPTYSFPSGHALFAFTFYVSLAIIVSPYVNQRARLALWAVTTTLIFLIGASRVFLGVHYPTDVLGGFITAALWLVMVEIIKKRKQ